MTQTLSIKNLSCGYADFKLNNIDFSAEQGSFIGIIGPNGAGKSTLLRACTGYVPVISGGVFIDGIDVAKMSSMIRAKKIAMVSKHEIADDMKVLEYVFLGRTPHYAPWQMVERPGDHQVVDLVLAMTGTTELQDKCMGLISEGERQLVCIARALAQEPLILLLDEPTSHLDIGHQVQILNIIKKMNIEKNITVVMVMHDLNMAALYCKRLLLMHQGKLIKDATPSEVLDPALISSVYKTNVSLSSNPYTQSPHIFLRPS